MNKKLIALAVAGACAAPLAMAQTANPVTLYGAVRLDLENVKASGGTNSSASRTRLTDHPSLLGVRGTEDLGGGLKAWFQLETGFTADDASGAFANRNSGVGFQGGWGTIMMGRWDMPFKTALGATDLWGDINKADWTSATADQGNFSRRTANVVQYWSPSWGGVTLRLAYSPDEGRTATAKPEQTGASIAYSAGKLYVAYGYEEHKDQSGTTTTAGSKEEGNAIGARYDIGNFRIAGHWGEYKKTGRDKETSYYVGAQFTAGKNAFLATYQNAEGGQASGAAEPDCDSWGLGWQYNFSKRTNMMISYVKVDNSGGMNCGFGAGAQLTGEDPEGYGIGLRHYF